MQAQDHAKEKLLQSLKEIIINKENHIGKRIKYDWKAAQTSLLNHRSLSHHKQQNQILQLLLQLQALYSSKFTPAFYSYYTILSILERNTNLCDEIQEEISRTNRSENNYQNIALLIHMRSKQVKEFVDRIDYSEEDIQKIRNSTILSIIKTQEWQQEFSIIVDYPVFFLWEEEPYLLHLAQAVQGSFVNKNSHDFLSQPNPFFLKVSQKMQEIVEQCLSILKSQRARSLQLSLNLPFFARNKHESPIKIQEKSNQKIVKLQNSLVFSKRKIHSTHTNAKPTFPSISKQQLSVIQKFRSLKNMKTTIKDTKQSLEYQHLFDNKIKRRIDELKEKVKNKTESSQIHEISQPKHNIKNKIRKQSLQKPESIKNSPIIDKKTILDSLNILKEERPKITPFLKSTSKQSLKDKRQNDKQKMENIIKETKFLLQSRSKQQEQLQAKNESLQTLKQDLLQKVKQKSSSIKPEKLPKGKNLPKNERYHSKQKLYQHAKEKEKKQILTRVDNEKRLLEQRNKSLIEEKARIEDQFQRKFKQLTERQKTAKQISNELSMKKLKVKNLVQKIEQTKNKAIEVENPNTIIEIEKLKKKKQLQYQLEKQKVQQVQSSLQNRVKQETKRLASLEQEQYKRQAQIQKQYQQQVSKLKAKHEEQQARILEKIKQEGEKQLLYEKKIKQEEQRLEFMSKEMEQWQRKEKELLISLKQQERKQQEKQSALRAQRKRRIDRQMEQLQQQQIQFLNKYKQTNQHLIDQLQQLKAKNHQLQQVLSFKE